ncbi:hypothetical protein EVG20_g9812 [Dentipellis fragilis]|uniref:Uncharacterized protein n=1 Tax=Dentipellis fragilis TaxID=205917 RepID=A0A4Y9XZZ4_9AGAM|nr:hypothetical protein EVG20_g9812 [Dentipellis fragilis]
MFDPLTQLIVILLFAIFGFSATGPIIRFLLWLIGFGAEGPIAGPSREHADSDAPAGTFAAWVQSLIGAVEEGSLFAWLQRIAMTDVPGVFKAIGGSFMSLFALSVPLASPSFTSHAAPANHPLASGTPTLSSAARTSTHLHSHTPPSLSPSPSPTPECPSTHTSPQNAPAPACPSALASRSPYHSSTVPLASPDEPMHAARARDAVRRVRRGA